MASKVSGVIEKIQSNGSSGTSYAIASTAYGYCQTAANQSAKIVDMTGFTLYEGVTVHIKFQYNNTAGSPTLNINSTGAKPIVQYGTTAVSTSDSTSGWYAGAVITFTYDGISWVRDQGFNTNTTYSYMRPYGSTASDVAAKTGSAGWKFQLTAGKYFMFTQYYDNTAQSALTLNIGSTGAKPIYINGQPSSASNYTLPGGQYLVYYDGTNYHFRTDDKIPGNIAGDAATVNGLTVQTAVPVNAVFTDTNKYHTTGSWGGTNNLTYTASAVNSADELQFTLATATTGAYGVTKLSSATNSDSEVLAATPKAIHTLDTKMNGLLAAANAMTFKGTIDSTNGSDATGSTNRKTLPATHNAGDTYRVAKEGTYAGKYCEVGTLIICTTDGTTANDAHWTSVETNEDGAVIGTTPTSSTDNAIVRWDGASGRIIQDSKITIDDNGNLLISHAASATMTADSTNPKITFAENGAQPVHLIYSDYDNYRAPAGLKIIGGTSATPAWLEVEGNTWSAGFKITGKTTSLTDNNLTFSSGGGWAMSDSTWIRTVGSKSVYMNAGTFRNDGTTLLRLLHHVNTNITADGTWETGGTGTDNSGDDYATRGTLGTSVLSIGNAIARPAVGTAGGKNNSKGYLRIYGEGTGYGELSYNDSMFASNKSIYLTNTTNSGISNEIRGLTATNDYWRVAGGATASNAGYMEIATGDDQNEPIYVRQYSGAFVTIKRTATLLDASGNTEFPVQVTAPKFIGALEGNADTATTADYLTTIVVTNSTIDSTTGSFAFRGSGDPWANTDWVGLQIGSNNDKWQLVAGGSGSNSLQFRQNDSGGTNTAWQSWHNIAHAATGAAIGGAKQPVYMAADGTITAGTALKNLAYKDSLTASDIPDISGTYLPLSGGTMSGSLKFVASSQMYNNKNIKWINSADTTDYAYIGTSTAGNIGIIAKSMIVLSANSSASAYKGDLNSSIRINGNSLYSNTNNDYSLGTSDSRWKNIYSQTAIYVGGTTFTAYDSNAQGTFICPGGIGLSNTAAGQGLYLRGGNIQYARMYIATIGTAPTATTTDGTTTYSGYTSGEVVLTLGNERIGANASNGVAHNARGRLRLYGTNNYYADLLAQNQGANHNFWLPNTTDNDAYLLCSYDQSGAIDLNTKYNAGIYCIEGGQVSNYPSGSTAYANLLVLPYRKPYGNSKPDYALQIYGHSTNRLWFRGSDQNNWRAWQELVHVAANTGAGSTNIPVYIATDGTVTAVSKYLATHVSGGSEEIQIKYSTTIDYWWGVGTANENHGLYDNKAAKWIILAGADNKWSFDGNAATATSATTATTATNIKTSNTSGYQTDQYGNFKHQITSTSNTWNIVSNAGVNNFSVNFENGNTSTLGNITATNGFNGDLNGNATTATSTTYLTSRGRLTSANTDNSNRSRIFTFLASSSMTEGKPREDGIITQFNWDNNYWAGQLYIPAQASGMMQYRGSNQNANTWGDWKTLLDSTNYTSYTVTKTGTGASGTWDISITGSSASCTGNAATATAIQTAGTTAQFYRGDNSWSNIIKQTANAVLGIDTNLKIGTARKDLNFDIATGTGSGINDGYAGGITWGTGAAAHAGIYCQTSGSYGTRLIFGTTGSYANGAYARMIIQSNGKVGIGTLSPDALLTVNGNGKFTGQIITSFKSSIAPGSYCSAQTTIPDLLEEVRYSSGCMGSFNLTTTYTLNNISLATGWYNFIYVPHRSGGVNGAASGDNCNYGVLYLHRMNAAGYADYALAYSSEAAKLLDLHASFQSAVTDGEIVIADGTLGHIKTSGYTTSSFATTDHTHNYAGSSSAGGAANSAIRINGNLGALTDTAQHNIWVSSTNSADGIPKYVTGVYVTASTGVITAKGFSGPLSGNATTATAATAISFTASNELILGNADGQAKIYINHRRVIGGQSSGNTAITDYYFRNGNASESGVTIHAASFSGNAATASKISAKLAATTKTYLLGTATTITATAANVDITGDTGVYLTTTAGELSAVRHSWNVSGTEKAYTVYNTTDDSIDFVFI